MLNQLLSSLLSDSAAAKFSFEQTNSFRGHICHPLFCSKLSDSWYFPVFTLNFVLLTISSEIEPIGTDFFCWILEFFFPPHNHDCLLDLLLPWRVDRGDNNFLIPGIIIVFAIIFLMRVAHLLQVEHVLVDRLAEFMSVDLQDAKVKIAYNTVP